MKTHGFRGAWVVACTVIVLLGFRANASPLKEATVTKLVNEVELIEPQKPSRPAVLRDIIKDDRGIQTGQRSRAELLFADQTLARLGEQTYFSFTPGTRELNLRNGRMLLQVPKGLGGATIHSAAVTAAITGTTIVFEYLPGKFVKVIVLEGSLRLGLNKPPYGRRDILAGEMITMDPEASEIPAPVKVNLKKFVARSNLVHMEPTPPTKSESYLPSKRLIDKEIALQEKERAVAELIDAEVLPAAPAPVPASDEPLILASNSSATSGPSPTPGPSPSPTPGPSPTPNPSPTPYPVLDPSAVPSPGGPGATTNPLPVIIKPPTQYVVMGGPTASVITTTGLPTINTLGNVSSGALYGGASVDGSASKFLFGSSSAFDAQVGFDGRFGASYDGVFPSAGIAVFLFNDMYLTGGPTFDTTGGPKDVALLSKNWTKTASPGGVFGLDGLRSLFLGVTGGSMTLDNPVSFAVSPGLGFEFLHLYTRNGKIDLGSSVTMPTARLFADASGDFTLGSTATIDADRIVINARGQAEFDGTVQANLLQVHGANHIILAGTIKAPAIFLSGGSFENTGTLDLGGKGAAAGSGAEGGDGGILIAGSDSAPMTGSFTVNAPISATTGGNDGAVSHGGAGGRVEVVTNDTITVASTIKVSDGAAGTASRSGGSVKLDSRRTNGRAIEITSSGQINALLAAAAPGPGGKIEFRSAGGDILVSGGTVRADKGTIDIRNTGSAGTINLTNATLNADVVKVGAMGKNGVLNVGGGSISADTTLKLYAAGSNGSVNFNDNVSLNGNSTKIIAGKSVTIQNGKVVTINGPSAAQVYTDNANYTGSGGNGSKTGQFGGKGATTSGFASAPGF